MQLRGRYKTATGVAAFSAAAVFAALFAVFFYGPVSVYPIAIYLGGGAHLVPAEWAEARALSRRLLDQADGQGIEFGNHSGLARLSGPEYRLEIQLTGALKRLALADAYTPQRVRRAFAGLSKGDARRAEILLGDLAADLTAKLETYDRVYDPDLQEDGGRRDAYHAATMATADFAVILRLNGQKERALRAYRAAAQINPDRQVGWLIYGHAALDLGAPDEAFDAYERVLDQADIYADRSMTALVMGAMALVSIAQDNLADASAFQHEAIRLDDEVGDRARVAIGLLHLGKIHELAGDIGIAITAYRSALDLQVELGDAGETARAHMWLGSLYLNQGDREAGCTHLRDVQIEYLPDWRNPAMCQ